MLSHLESCTYLLEMLFTPFFLSLFFFCSGYVYKAPKNFGALLHKKFFQLFIPWFVFSVANIIMSQVLSFNEHHSLSSELAWNFLQIRGKGDGLWFVSALFVTFIPFYFLIKWYQKKTFCPKRAYVLVVISFILSFINLLWNK